MYELEPGQAPPEARARAKVALAVVRYWATLPDGADFGALMTSLREKISFSADHPWENEELAGVINRLVDEPNALPVPHLAR